MISSVSNAEREVQKAQDNERIEKRRAQEAENEDNQRQKQKERKVDDANADVKRASRAVA